MMNAFTENNDGTVTLQYEGQDGVVVKREDFDRAFGAMANATREEVERDFGVKTAHRCGVEA